MRDGRATRGRTVPEVPSVLDDRPVRIGGPGAVQSDRFSGSRRERREREDGRGRCVDLDHEGVRIRESVGIRDGEVHGILSERREGVLRDGRDEKGRA